MSKQIDKKLLDLKEEIQRDFAENLELKIKAIFDERTSKLAKIANKDETTLEGREARLAVNAYYDVYKEIIDVVRVK